MNAPADPGFAQRCRQSFGRQKAMSLIGASLTVVEPGYVEIALPFREDLTQQKGFIHGGILGMIADTEVYADDGKHVASMQQTLMMLANTPDSAE